MANLITLKLSLIAQNLHKQGEMLTHNQKKIFSLVHTTKRT